MILNIFKNYRKNLISVIFLIIGYIIGISSLSVGISVINDVRQYSLDSTSGNPDDTIISFLEIKNCDDDIKNIVSNLVNNISKEAEVQLINLNDVNINGRIRSTIVLECSKAKVDWHIPIIEGRYFTIDECSSDDKVVIVGKELAESLFPQDIDDDSTIEILNDRYKVIGICGRESRDTQWDNVIYIPFNSAKHELSNMIKKDNSYCNMEMFLRKSDNKTRLEDLVNRNIEDELKDKSYLYDLNFDKVENIDNSSLFNSIAVTVVIGGLILLIVVINVMNLSIFWIFNRKKEICIKKMLGATDNMIIVSIIMETTIIAVFSALCALIIQILVVNSIGVYLKDLEISCKVSLVNFIACFIIAIVCGLISSISPIREMLKMEPIEAFNS